MTARPSAQARLQAAADMVGAYIRTAEASVIIRRLVTEHGATFKRHPATNTLRVAGCQATCTWSDGDGLLDAWRRNATIKLMQMRGLASAERESVS